MKLQFAIVVAILVAGVNGIYPDGHFNFATKLTQENVNEFVKNNVDAGKTVFIRTIASPGWGWWRKQAPGWNTIIKQYHENDDVVFGDIDLSSSPIRTIHGENQNPGSGGWPTIRYFNKKTGYGGSSYTKKTSKAMCEELKDTKYMSAYVEEMGSTSLCSVYKEGNPGCNDKEVKYIQKNLPNSKDEHEKKLRRLNGMVNNKMSEKSRDWILKRISLLNQFIKNEQSNDNKQTSDL
jgi:hypothetical protein